MSLRDALDWTSTALNDPVGQLSRWQRSVRTAVRIGRYSLRHLAADRAPQMAAARLRHARRQPRRRVDLVRGAGRRARRAPRDPGGSRRPRTRASARLA